MQTIRKRRAIMNIGDVIKNKRQKKNITQAEMLKLRHKLCQDGRWAFPIVKDTTQNITTPRLYITIKDKTLDVNNLLQHQAPFLRNICSLI